jgi:hypothetical protein
MRGKVRKRGGGGRRGHQQEMPLVLRVVDAQGAGGQMLPVDFAEDRVDERGF